jgi:putative heme iron utilization protein
MAHARDNIVFHSDANLCVRRSAGDASNGKMFSEISRLLRRHGFTVTSDPEVDKNYKSLRKWHRLVSKETNHGALFVSAHYFPNGMEFTGYQNVVFENKSGGKYDFDRLAKMPYLIRLTWVKFTKIVIGYLKENGIELAPPTPRWQDDPLAAFNNGWTPERFRRDASGWPDESQLKLWNQLDASGIRINQGEYRYVCGHGNRWWRVRVYGGINGMWIGVSGAGITNHNACSYYSTIPVELLRKRCVSVRRVSERLMKAYVASLNEGNYRKASGIRREMARQGVDVPILEVAGQE